MGKPQCIEKASRLVEYLIRLTDLQRKSIKDLANYEQVLWFHEVPRLKGCFTPAWGADQDVDDSVWLEVQWTGDYVFENEWQSFRTKKDRSLELKSAT